MASVSDKRSTGRGWVARWRDPEGHQRSKSFERKRDAEVWLTKVEGSKLTGDYVAPAGGKVLFGERFDHWFATTVNLRASTRARDETYARSMILPTFAGRPLASIDHDAVQAWVADLTRRGYAPATVVKAHQITSKVIASAVRARLISMNPCDDTALPKIERDEQRFLTPHEVARLSDAIDPAARVLVLVAAYTGLRAGELFGLRRNRVDLLRAEIDVAEIVVEVRGEHQFGPPKTRAGRRRVPTPRVVADELAGHMAGLEPNELVFTAKRGEPIRASNFRRRVWTPATIAAGLAEPGGRPLRLHDLRHTAVAFWIAAGANPNEIARRAGHSSVVTVLDRYGHLLPSESDHVTDALDQMARAAADDHVEGVVLDLRRS